MSFISQLVTVIVTTILFFIVLKIVLVLKKKHDDIEYIKKHGEPQTSDPPKKGPNDELDDLLFSLVSENKTSGEVVNVLLEKGYTMKDIHLAYDRFSLKNPNEKNKHL